MKTLRTILCLLLTAALLLALPLAASADDGQPFALTVVVAGNEMPVRALQDAYAGNLYLSLRDLSAALSGSAKQFRYFYTYTNEDGYIFHVSPGEEADNLSSGSSFPAESKVTYLPLRRNRLYVGEQERKYYSYREDTNLYLSLTDIELMLDVTAKPLSETRVEFLTDTPFRPNPQNLREDGYFEAFNAIVLGDVTNGKLLFTSQASRSFPIASLTKLMSYLLIVEAVEDGRAGWNDLVPVSAAAEALSDSADGIIEMHEGMYVPLSELVAAMLLASSNESALALAEYVAGSEAAFVERMNQRAKELELKSAEFYTATGLPVYVGESVPVKRQNQMSANDLFTLCGYLLEHFPQLTDITARQYVKLPTLDYTTANSNPMVFNMEGVTGLKTGNTNRAGYCLTVSLPVSVGGEGHDLILVMLGAESVEIRGQAAEILLRWAQQIYAD